MKLILGSSSKYRKNILKKAGYVFEVLIPDVDEKLIKTDNPYERPLVLARAKADVLQNKIKEPAIIITSDTVIVADGKLYEKPESEQEARQFLEEYSRGLAPQVVTALVVNNTQTGECHEGVDVAKVFFKPFPPSIVEDFIKSGEAFLLAGGFTLRHPLIEPYVEKIEGTEDSVIGLPLHLLEELLKKSGYSN